MRAHELEAFNITSVKDETVPSSMLPVGALRCAIDELMERPPAVITVENPIAYIQLPFGNSFNSSSVGEYGYSLRQSSSAHVRSFVIEHPELAEGIADEFGNTFGSFTLKGNNFSSPKLIETATAQNGIMAYGLQESGSMRRVLRASRLLRENGVGTEYIVGISEPKSLPVPNPQTKTDEVQFTGRNEYKQKLIFSRWDELDEENRSFEALTDIRTAVNGTAYYITLRAMDSDYRLSDILGDTNISQSVREQLSTTDTEITLSAYLKDFILPTVAKNMAIMHTLGLAHRFPHHGNISALGSIVDLDSVHGATLELGDDPITLEDAADDIEYFLANFHRQVTPGINIVEIMGIFLREYTQALHEKQTDTAFSTLDVLNEYRERLIDPSLNLNYIIGIGHFVTEEALDLVMEEYFPDELRAYTEASTTCQTEVSTLLGLEGKEIRGQFHEYLLAYPFHFIDASFTNLVNEYSDELESGDIRDALTELFDKGYDDMYVGAENLAADFIADIVSLREENIDVRTAIGASVEFARSVVDERKAEIIHRISEYLTQARAREEELLGQSRAAYLSGKGNIIYEGFIDNVEVLRQIAADPTKETSILQIDYEKNRAGYEYKVERGVQLVQAVVFDLEDHYAGSGYSYKLNEESDSYDACFDLSRASLFVLRNQDGSLRYEIVTANPSLFTESNISSPEKFEQAWHASPDTPEQGQLFDDYEFTTGAYIKSIQLASSLLNK